MLLDGLSPRVRGNPYPPGHVARQKRSIPARAGELPHRPNAPCPKVYPRACGGTGHSTPRRARGLSPRVRGNRRTSPWTVQREVYPRACGGTVHMRNYPYDVDKVYPRACGGTTSLGLAVAITRVYPRACGGTVRVRVVHHAVQGLSPRVRGNRHCRRSTIRPNAGSIPARAGEPTIRSSPNTPSQGLSPRVRGNPLAN